MGDDMEAVVTSLLERGLSEDSYQFFLELGKQQNIESINISDYPMQIVLKALSFLGYKGEDFRDWGFSKSRKTSLITLLGSDDDFVSRSLAAIGVLEQLVKQDGVSALQPHLSAIMEILTVENERRNTHQD